MPNASQSYAERASLAFNTRDLDALLSLWSADFVYVDPNGSSRGLVDARAREEALFNAFPDIKVVMTPIAWTPQRLALDVVLTGTHLGPFPFGGRTAAPSGREIRTRMAAHFTFKDGLAIREDAFYDRLELLTQLGFLGS